MCRYRYVCWDVLRDDVPLVLEIQYQHLHLHNSPLHHINHTSVLIKCKRCRAYRRRYPQCQAPFNPLTPLSVYPLKHLDHLTLHNTLNLPGLLITSLSFHTSVEFRFLLTSVLAYLCLEEYNPDLSMSGIITCTVVVLSLYDTYLSVCLYSA